MVTSIRDFGNFGDLSCGCDLPPVNMTCDIPPVVTTPPPVSTPSTSSASGTARAVADVTAIALNNSIATSLGDATANTLVKSGAINGGNATTTGSSDSTARSNATGLDGGIASSAARSLADANVNGFADANNTVTSGSAVDVSNSSALAIGNNTTTPPPVVTTPPPEIPPPVVTTPPPCGCPPNVTTPPTSCPPIVTNPPNDCGCGTPVFENPTPCQLPDFLNNPNPCGCDTPTIETPSSCPKKNCYDLDLSLPSTNQGNECDFCKDDKTYQSKYRPQIDLKQWNNDNDCGCGKNSNNNDIYKDMYTIPDCNIGSGSHSGPISSTSSSNETGNKNKVDLDTSIANSATDYNAKKTKSSIDTGSSLIVGAAVGINSATDNSSKNAVGTKVKDYDSNSSLNKSKNARTTNVKADTGNLRKNNANCNSEFAADNNFRDLQAREFKCAGKGATSSEVCEKICERSVTNPNDTTVTDRLAFKKTKNKVSGCNDRKIFLLSDRDLKAKGLSKNKVNTYNVSSDKDCRSNFDKLATAGIIKTQTVNDDATSVDSLADTRNSANNSFDTKLQFGTKNHLNTDNENSDIDYNDTESKNKVKVNTESDVFSKTAASNSGPYQDSFC